MCKIKTVMHPDLLACLWGGSQRQLTVSTSFCRQQTSRCTQPSLFAQGQDDRVASWPLQTFYHLGGLHFIPAACYCFGTASRDLYVACNF